MKIIPIVSGIVAAIIVLAAGVATLPYAFTDRVREPLTIAGHSAFGRAYADLPEFIFQVGKEFSRTSLPVEFRGQQHSSTLGELGITLNVPATVQAIQDRPWNWRLKPQAIEPHLVVNSAQLGTAVETLFKNVIRSPKNASLLLSPSGRIQLVKSQTGEAVDTQILIQDIRTSLQNQHAPVTLQVVPAAPRVEDAEVDRARELTQKLFASGLTLNFEDRSFTIAAPELSRLIEFSEQVDVQQPENYLLGVRLNPERLRKHLATIAEEVNQEPMNAKFEISQVEGEAEPRVQEFAAPERGLTLNIESSAQRIAHAVTIGEIAVPLTVNVIDPEIQENTDLKNLGIVGLLARGESDFTGSPRNRIHNIAVGTSRYHGLLIPPSAEFSFNEHLGPVNAAAGFKPELVIKAHETIPEFGGGLCQVSTTAFRAAIYSGLEITERRNHAYAVRYYGLAGFDATIYPGYTDLRFRNNTPGHILVQTKIEGSKLTFEFWGTPDGREVEVEGPTPYNRRPDGAVKATLVQRVKKDGQVVEKSFASNYRSPNLYPKVLAANATQPTPTAPPAPVERPSPSPTQAPIKPKPSPPIEEGNS